MCDHLEFFQPHRIWCNIWALPKSSQHGNQGYGQGSFYHTLGHRPSHPHYLIKSNLRLSTYPFLDHISLLQATQGGEEIPLIFISKIPSHAHSFICLTLKEPIICTMGSHKLSSKHRISILINLQCLLGVTGNIFVTVYHQLHSEQTSCQWCLSSPQKSEILDGACR